MKTTVPATKRFIPVVRAGLVKRARLTERLEAALRPERAAVVMSAPDGYGMEV